MNLVSNVHQALVYDFGSSSIQMGFAGDLIPVCSTPSWYTVNHLDNDSVRFSDEWAKKHQSHLDVHPMLTDEYSFAGAEIMTPFLDWTYNLCFDENDQPDLAQWPVLFSQPTYLLSEGLRGLGAFERRQRQFAELAFDFHTHISFAHDASLACYARGVHTGVVVDFGWCCLRVVPVIEGHPLRNAIAINRWGGKQLCEELQRLIRASGRELATPLERAVGPDGAEASQVAYCRKDMVMDIIKTHLRFGDARGSGSVNDYVYFMAERELICLQDELRCLEGVLWEDTGDGASLQGLVKQAILGAPIEYQGALWHSVILSGGLSRLPGFSETLLAELEAIAPVGIKPKIIPPKCREAAGEFTTWVGGSIVASTDNFMSSCVSVEEWRENGSVANKFI